MDEINAEYEQPVIANDSDRWVLVSYLAKWGFFHVKLGWKDGRIQPRLDSEILMKQYKLTPVQVMFIRALAQPLYLGTIKPDDVTDFVKLLANDLSLLTEDQTLALENSNA